MDKDGLGPCPVKIFSGAKKTLDSNESFRC